MEIEANVKARLERAVRQLLNAGRDTQQVAAALAPQQSFGKYDGCTPTAIEEIARKVCKEINAQLRADYKAGLSAATARLRADFPDMGKYFTGRSS